MTIFDPIKLAQDLIKCPSVTPKDAGALDVLENTLGALGFDVSCVVFDDENTPTVNNLYARIGKEGPNFCFAGHTDVVPPGREDAWMVRRFEARITDGVLFGRGAADMKSAIAAFVSACERYLSSETDFQSCGSISLLITGDEEGPAINGTRKMLDWLKKRGEIIDHCLVGEPTNPSQMGQMIKVGRRGSINAWVTIRGSQGHVAYPDRARNPLHAVSTYIDVLTREPLDDGYARFQPSSLQITEIETDNSAHNVIPADVLIRLNVRFNPNWSGAQVHTWIETKLKDAYEETGFAFDLESIVSGEAFLTTDDTYLAMLAQCVERQTGSLPELSTSGGTSDARFIQRDAPVAEFGLVGATMHKIDECVATDDIIKLTDIYTDILKTYFTTYGRVA